ncbi:MAG: LuxR family transcriptional regulator, regulator of acetate metabolism [Pseudonocardiales bacterium]|nr:LuxR family transcriptional regulator, regulator of acetate metabolism [Pseudonocardiales bacterium]
MSPWLTMSEEEILWDFVDRAPVALLAADSNRRIARVNERWSDLLGYSSAQACEMGLDELLAPESRPGIEMRWADLLGTGMGMARIVMLRADGDRVHVRYGAFANVIPGIHVAACLPEPGQDGRMNRPARSRRAGQLTRREQESLRLVAAGMTTIAAAEQLGISPETVRTHVRNAMNKLGARTRAQAIAVAMRDGEIPG